jgi:hypothetical protein
MRQLLLGNAPHCPRHANSRAEGDKCGFFRVRRTDWHLPIFGVRSTPFHGQSSPIDRAAAKGKEYLFSECLEKEYLLSALCFDHCVVLSGDDNFMSYREDNSPAASLDTIKAAMFNEAGRSTPVRVPTVAGETDTSCSFRKFSPLTLQCTSYVAFDNLGSRRHV